MVTKLFALLALILALAGLLPTRQEPPHQDTHEEQLPAPLSEYMGRRIAATMHWSGAEWLLRETRESEEHTTRMITALDLCAGQVVCDFGCGVGYVALPMAKLVLPEGRILALDIQPEMLAALEKRAVEAGVTNMERRLCGPADPKLAPASCDLVLMVDVYHELGYPEQVLHAVRGALKPAGRLVLVEFRAEDPDVPIQPEHKMTREQVERELGANGFRFEHAFEGLPWQHLLFFERDDTPAR